MRCTKDMNTDIPSIQTDSDTVAAPHEIRSVIYRMRLDQWYTHQSTDLPVTSSFRRSAPQIDMQYIHTDRDTVAVALSITSGTYSSIY